MVDYYEMKTSYIETTFVANVDVDPFLLLRKHVFLLDAHFFEW